VAEHGREGIEEISSIAYGFMGSQALFAALELGLFTSLSLGSRDETELADELDARPEALRTLLTACRAMGLLERDEGGYRNSARAQRFLVRTSRSYMGDYYLRQIALTVYEQVPLARAVLRGELEVSPSYGAFLDDPDRTEEFIRGQHAGSSGPAYLLATSEDLSRFSRLLDLGGGSGVFSIEAVRRNPALGAVVFDHAGVIPVARTIIAEAGLADRIDCVAGDLVRDAWPPGADLLLLSYVLSSYPLEDLIARTFEYLPDGGCLLVHDFALDADRSGPRNTALWFFANLAISAETSAHTVDDITGAMRQAGFTQVEARPHIPSITHLIRGVK
jgi:hypothetical protein